ncbi:MAG: tetratricopeptide repeat protein, partial [Planctomycetota bacterium]
MKQDEMKGQLHKTTVTGEESIVLYAETFETYRGAKNMVLNVNGSVQDDDASALNAQAIELCQQRKYVEAEPLFKRSLAVMEKALG